MNSRIKEEIPTVAEKNRILANIIRAIDERDDFLLVGHQNPDEDCLASMVAFGLLLAKFNETSFVVLCGRPQDQFEYLVRICRYNGIQVLEACGDMPKKVSTVVILDTPKPSMIEGYDLVVPYLEDPEILKIEIDHHLQSDSTYAGDPGFRMVTGASSACELIARLSFKIAKREDLLAKYQIQEVFTRNLVLSILTGIIGDSRMGQYLKTRWEIKSYERFSGLFDDMLKSMTAAGSQNYATKEQVFDAVTSLSLAEEACYRYMLARRRAVDAVPYVALDYEEASFLHRSYGADTLVAVSKSVADRLAEDGGFVGLVVYPDEDSVSDLVQFRMRRSRAFLSLDLRDLLGSLEATNGGGHPGAVGFRFPKSEVRDVRSFTQDLVGKVAAIIRAGSGKAPGRPA